MRACIARSRRLYTSPGTTCAGMIDATGSHQQPSRAIKRPSGPIDSHQGPSISTTWSAMMASACASLYA